MPLVSFGIGTLVWGLPFARARWRLLAWYYGLLLPYAGFAYYFRFSSNNLIGPIVGLGALFFWAGGVAGGLLVPKRPRIVQPIHLCRHCQYDLTGNVSGICPECGRPISLAQQTFMRWSFGGGPAHLN